jgi:glycosyl transferase family 2
MSEANGSTSANRLRRAVFTMVRDEAVRLPIWLRYYSRFFAPEDIYVIDHASTDGSTDGDGFTRLRVQHETVDTPWMWEVIQEQQHRLLETYDTVLYTDVDEIVAPDPRTGTLADYIDRFDGDFVTCRGYELIHLRDSERPLDLSRPVLQQRSHWFRSRRYSKPLLARIPLHWRPGGHRCHEGRRRPDPVLHLVHLHRMDYSICLERHRRFCRWSWSSADLDNGFGWHDRISTAGEFDRWFYGDSLDRSAPMTIEVIPAHWRGLF